MYRGHSTIVGSVVCIIIFVAITSKLCCCFLIDIFAKSIEAPQVSTNTVNNTLCTVYKCVRVGDQL